MFRKFLYKLGKKLVNKCGNDIDAPVALVKSESRLGTHSTNFSIYNANGGKVIETYSYDRKTDRENRVLYVIHDEDSLGDELESILIKERLIS